MVNQVLRAGAFVAAIAACAPSQPAPDAAAPAAAEAGVALYALDCGQGRVSDADVFADDGAYAGVARDLVTPCYLVRHPAGDLVWDLGLGDVLAETPEGVTNGPFSFKVTKTLAGQLGELGLTPADIEFVSISHSHGDHVGNAPLFAPTATWLVDPEERAWMFRDEARADPNFAAVGALEAAKTVEILHEAPHDVFGDGSVVIHPAPGHTPGHRVLMVTLAESGAVLLTGDMFHLAEARERRTVPRFNTDRAETLASMDALEALAQASGARVVRQHVPEDFAALPAFPSALR